MLKICVRTQSCRPVDLIKQHLFLLGDLRLGVVVHHAGEWVKCVARTRTRVNIPALGFYEWLKICVTRTQPVDLIKQHLFLLADLRFGVVVNG